MDPFDSTPLSALYTLESINTKPITVRVLGKTADMDIAHTYPANYGTELAIHGLYPNYKNTIIIEGGEVSQQTNITTLALPNTVNTTINRTKFVTGDPFNQNLYFLINMVSFVVGVDNKGETRYYVSTKNPGGFGEFRGSYKNNKIHLTLQ